MRLSDLDGPAVSETEFTPVHSSAGDVGLRLQLRDYNSKEYRKLASAHYKAISERFDDTAESNAITECVSLIAGWNIDDYECTPENIIEMLADAKKAWIAYQVHDWVIGKKLRSGVLQNS